MVSVIWLETTNKMRKLFIPLVFSLFLLTGCENNDFLQSESTVNGKLNGSWKKYGSTSADLKEIWKMDNGSLTIISRINDKDSVIDHGHYTVLTKFSKIYITISNITNPGLAPQDLNTRWNISALNKTQLYLSTTTNGGALISREFVKQ